MGSLLDGFVFRFLSCSANVVSITTSPPRPQNPLVRHPDSSGRHYPRWDLISSTKKTAPKLVAEAHWARLQGLLSHSACPRDGACRGWRQRPPEQLWSEMFSQGLSTKSFLRTSPTLCEAWRSKLSCSANCLPSLPAHGTRSTLKGVSTSENTSAVGSLCKDSEPNVPPISPGMRGIAEFALSDSGPMCTPVPLSSLPCRRSCRSLALL